jgi:serine/threonine protein kinase
MSRGWSTEISRGYVSESQGHPLSLMEIVKTNVLIDGAKQARLADFGLLAMISDATNLLSSTSFTQGGTPQWMSPELLDPKGFGLKDGRPTEHSDCYALGMLIYEVLSGQIPFSQQCGHPIALILRANALRDRKKWVGRGLRMKSGVCWSIAGSPVQATARGSGMYSSIWRMLRGLGYHPLVRR